MPSAALSLLFPDDCRICEKPLVEVHRYPVCRTCLEACQPFMAEYFCAACGTPFLNSRPLDEQGLCGLCRRGLTGFDAAYCYGSYEGVLRRLIHLYKYSGIHTLSRPFGDRLALALPLGRRFDVIVPVPLHWRRKWQRGYNQSELLGHELTRRMGIPVVRALRRGRATRAQAGLSNAGRRDNVSGAFSIRDASQVRGKKVLLVDDVLTTGATAAACARVLKRSGASQVAVITLARVDRRPAGLSFANPTFAGVGS
ncbi:MAG: ComF family protein [Acidobacteria bacterium]|nr:ComF family protein [Acidobacteriota bacterium]